jgi:hypothetical protein
MRSLLVQDPESADVFVTTDASPTGLCVVLYAPGNKQLLAWRGFIFPFDTNAFQNAREYLGLLMALCMVDWYRSVHKCPMSRVHWTNDNKAALTWAADNKCNSLASQIAFYGVAWKQLSAQLVLVGVTHIPGVLMGNIDSVSRQLPHTLPIELLFPLSESQQGLTIELLKLCDPTVSRDLMKHQDAFAAVVRMMT